MPADIPQPGDVWGSEIKLGNIGQEHYDQILLLYQFTNFQLPLHTTLPIPTLKTKGEQPDQKYKYHLIVPLSISIMLLKFFDMKTFSQTLDFLNLKLKKNSEIQKSSING